MGDRQSDFVNMMLPYAIAVGKKTGLDPRLVIAQSALETGYGQSAPNNNYFGVKSHGKQGGATMATTEVYNGQPTRVNDSFRTYSDPGQSAADYAQFLLDNPRYRGVLAETTLGGQINAMGSSGYATDPQYADKLRAIATGLPISEGAMIGAETMAALGKGPTVSFLPNGDMNTGGGGMAGGNVTMSTMGGQQEQAPSIWNNLFGGALADPDKRARLAIALEGMTLNPNQALIQTQAEGIKSRADEKKAATEINRTAAWLRSQGRDDLAAAVESGALGGRDAAGIAMQPKPKVEPMSAAGKLEADYRAGLITPEAYKAGIAGLAPAGTTVNVGAGENAFAKKTGEVLAQEAADIAAQGAIAQRNLGTILTLETALSNSPQGAAGALANFASGLGIKTDGASDLEVANAMINQLVPQQRPPGSGTMSDADLALFKQSLPQIINTPGGNQKIIATMRAVAEYDVKRGQIARALQLGQITQDQAFNEYNALGNPLAEFANGAMGATATVPAGVDPEDWAVMTPEEKAAFQ